MRSNRVMHGVAALALTLGLATAAGCERDEQRQVGSAAENAGRGAVDAVKSAGHGVVYGGRELGQSLSGTQGDPAAEERARRAREEMERNAAQAGERLERAGETLTNDRESPSEGGGLRRGGGPTE